MQHADLGHCDGCRAKRLLTKKEAAAAAAAVGDDVSMATMDTISESTALRHLTGMPPAGRPTPMHMSGVNGVCIIVHLQDM